MKFLFFLFLFVYTFLIRFVSLGPTSASHASTATPHLEVSASHTSGHTPWGFTSRSGRIATTVTSPGTIASVSTSITTVITSIATAPLASGSTPLAGASTVTSTATAAHHVHLTRIHATGELRFGSHFFHFHFMTVNIYCAFFKKFFRHIFSFVCDKAAH